MTLDFDFECSCGASPSLDPGDGREGQRVEVDCPQCGRQTSVRLIGHYKRTEGERVLLENMLAYEAVVRDPTLSPGAVKLWCIYRAEDRIGNGCYWGDGKVAAQFAGKSIPSIKRYRAELVEAGLLKVTRRRNQTAVMRALTPLSVVRAMQDAEG
jgi:hypothetical protein